MCILHKIFFFGVGVIGKSHYEDHAQGLNRLAHVVLIKTQHLPFLEHFISTIVGLACVS